MTKLRFLSTLEDVDIISSYSNESELRMSLITYLNVKYEADGKYPTFEKLCLLYSRSTQAELKAALEAIEAPLTNRGLPIFKLDRDSNDGFDPHFVLACNMVLDFNDKRSIPAKLKDAGLTTAQWKAFLRKKKHRDYFESLLGEGFDKDVDNNAKLGLARAIESGDLQSIKYYYELTAKYRPQEAVLQNFQLMVVQMMEIFAKYVTAEILSKVADELEQMRILQSNPLIDTTAKELTA